MQRGLAQDALLCCVGVIRVANSARQFNVMQLRDGDCAPIPDGGVSQSLVAKHLANMAE
jgi:hypothetical protein